MIKIDFTNKIYIITGAASGLGRVVAIELSKLGANLILVDLNNAGLEETKAYCHPNARIVLLPTDITDFNSLKIHLSEIIEKLDKGGVAGVVHCAGIPCIMPIKTLSYETYLRVMQVNTFAALEIVKWFANKKNHVSDNPSVVLISSVYGLVGSAGNTAYAMSKGAIQSMTKSLAIELASKGIRVNCVAPGFMHTKMETNTSKYFDSEHEQILESLHPLGLGYADDVAGMICFLLSEQSRWVTGAIISVDGGFTAQ